MFMDLTDTLSQLDIPLIHQVVQDARSAIQLVRHVVVQQLVTAKVAILGGHWPIVSATTIVQPHLQIVWLENITSHPLKHASHVILSVRLAKATQIDAHLAIQEKYLTDKDSTVSTLVKTATYTIGMIPLMKNASKRIPIVLNSAPLVNALNAASTSCLEWVEPSVFQSP